MSEIIIGLVIFTVLVIIAVALVAIYLTFRSKLDKGKGKGSGKGGGKGTTPGGAGTPLNPGGPTKTPTISNFVIGDATVFAGITGLLSMNANGSVTFDTTKTINANTTWTYGNFKGTPNVLHNGNGMALTAVVKSGTIGQTFKGLTVPVNNSMGPLNAVIDAPNVYDATVSSSWVYTDNRETYSAPGIPISVWLIANAEHLPVSGITINIGAPPARSVTGVYLTVISGTTLYNFDSITKQPINISQICVADPRSPARSIVCS